MPNVTKQLITRDMAKRMAPEYVKFIERDGGDGFEQMYEKFSKLKRGQQVVTCLVDYENKAKSKYVLAKVSSVNHKDFRAVDGPIVRVSNGEFSWRVDGCGYAYPVERHLT